MRPPIDEITGTITGYDERRGVLLIEAPYQDYPTMLRREYKKVSVQLIDSRPLSDRQRRACYALLGDIAEYTGEGKDTTKEWMKLKFMVEDVGQTGERLFSLATAPMSLVAAFQRFLVRFILEWDIPTTFPLLDFVDDVEDYTYSCLVNKRCAVCGGRAELHHVDHVGMGRDRDEIIHEGMRALPLCRKHHTEAHDRGQESFESLYHLPHGIVLDKTLCRIYGLKTRRKNAEQDRTHGPSDP